MSEVRLRKFRRELNKFVERFSGIKGATVVIKWVKADLHPYWCDLIIPGEVCVPFSVSSRMEIIDAVVDLTAHAKELKQFAI
jgi:hypothetical protein